MDIPCGKRESENCRGGVVRVREGCERASTWRGFDALLVIPHLAYREEELPFTVSRAGRRATSEWKTMLELRVRRVKRDRQSGACYQNAVSKETVDATGHTSARYGLASPIALLRLSQQLC